jgi:hypothetical protein
MQEIDHLVTLDTRECIGELSLNEARLLFLYTNIVFTDSILSSPNSIDDIKLLNSSNEKLRQFKGENRFSSLIKNNKIEFKFKKNIKSIVSFEIVNISIPRDIIPIYVYFPDFVTNCIYKKKENFIDISSPGYDSPVPVSKQDFNDMNGLFHTPLRYFRTYIDQHSMPNAHTPPPYQLWNPPQDNLSSDPWPFQPQPKKRQRCPIYRAKNGLIFSGFGLYDLEDFPHLQEITLRDGVKIQIPLRKIILKMIIPEGQYINDKSAKYIIENSIDHDFNLDGVVDNPLIQTGYGDYQRFIPGPGLGMNYQPNQPRKNKSSPIDLGCSTYDAVSGSIGPMPTPFPNFRGNCWGPYGRPGDRFQNSGLQDTLDELYMNGDLSNIGGESIIHPEYNPTESSYTFEMMMENSHRVSYEIATFSNIESSQNPNILNAMRVIYDGGFGAVQVYVGINMTEKGKPGSIVVTGLPNTQYDGTFHKFNSEIWVKKKSTNPMNWEDSLPGPHKPSIVSGEDFKGWMYSWRPYPLSGSIYVPITAGGVGPMEYNDMDSDSPQWRKSESTLNDSFYTTGSSQWVNSPVIGCSNYWRIPTSGNTVRIGNIPWGHVISIKIVSVGNGYTSSPELITESITGNGSGLTVSTENGLSVNNSGSGYKTGDTAKIIQSGSGNNYIIEIMNVSMNETTIPAENVSHYIDPIATSNVSFVQKRLEQDYINGIRTNVPCDNYQEPQASYVFSEGSVSCENSNSTNDPRPNVLPVSLLKCDFSNLPSPVMEWDSGSKNNRPLDNNRIRQMNNYINMRISYRDRQTGTFIESIKKYLLYLIKSIPNTDIVININQLKRTIHTQNINDTSNQSNFNIPIRLNSEYIENQQEFLSKYNNKMWSIPFYPPLVSLGSLELEFFTQDGTPIPLERTLGFKRKIKDTTVVFSQQGTTRISLNQPYILSELSGSDFVPSSGIMICNSNYSFDPRISNFTRNNISITFKFSSYINCTRDCDMDYDVDTVNDFIPTASNVYEY